MWSGLSEICRREGGSIHEVCTAVADRKGENTSLTAAIRVFVMAYYRAAATEEGHTKTGHGYGIATLVAGLAGNHPVVPAQNTAQPNSALQNQMGNNHSSPYGSRIMAINGVNRSGFR